MSELQKVPPSELAADDGFGFGVVLPAEAKPQFPRVSIYQPAATTVIEGAKHGNWVSNSPQFDYGPAIRFIAIGLYMTRSFWRNRTDEQPACVSSDAVTPTAGQGPAEGGNAKFCVSCALAQWSGKGSERKPPVCALAYNYVGILAHDEGPVLCRIRFQRTAFDAGKQIFAICEAGKAAKVPQRTYERVIELTTKEKSRSKTERFFVPAARLVGLTRDLAPELLELAAAGAEEFRAMKAQFAVADAADASEGTGHTEAPGSDDGSIQI